VLYVDGGVLLANGPPFGRHAFVGFTSFTTNGNIGGRVQAHTRCAAEFAGSHQCNEYEYRESRSSTTLSAAGAWLDYGDTTDGDVYNDSYCARWTSSATTNSSAVVLPTGYTTTAGGLSCASVLPLACCRGSRTTLRGFTTFTSNGNMGGRIQTHARCAAEFPGSHVCNEYEFREARSSLPVPSPGAWLDYGDTTDGNVYNDSYCTRWTSSSSTNSSAVALPTGYTTTAGGLSCASVLPLACCD
jgi:hypothetical protein